VIRLLAANQASTSRGSVKGFISSHRKVEKTTAITRVKGVCRYTRATSSARTEASMAAFCAGSSAPVPLVATLSVNFQPSPKKCRGHPIRFAPNTEFRPAREDIAISGAAAGR
jgi:hypothetical protein